VEYEIASAKLGRALDEFKVHHEQVWSDGFGAKFIADYTNKDISNWVCKSLNFDPADDEEIKCVGKSFNEISLSTVGAYNYVLKYPQENITKYKKLYAGDIIKFSGHVDSINKAFSNFDMHVTLTNLEIVEERK